MSPKFFDRFAVPSVAWCYLLLAFLLLVTTSQARGAESARDSWIAWIDRPWSTKKLLVVMPSSDWNYSKESAIRDNVKPGRKFFDWEEYFLPTTILPVKEDPTTGEKSLSLVAIEFDQDGIVVSRHTHNGPLRGRLNQLQRIGISEGEAVNDRFFELAHWFTGLGDASTDWAPAFCNQYQRPNGLNAKSDDYLYGKMFKSNGYRPLFGCREWAYQLYDNERPYIDVTSYEPTSKGRPPKGYIREFIGWVRFSDNKPVIGQHEGDWYCLHDCPGGDKPGLIPDIKSWAKRFDWSVPLPPSRVPTFPDPPAKAGTYINGP